MADLYQALGVDRAADADTIKRAFRKIAFQCHPDRNPNNPTAVARFRAAVEAYEVLSDPARRRVYDTSAGSRPEPPKRGPTPTGWEWLNADRQCPTCRGTGAPKGARWEPCEECDGQGTVVGTTGFFQVEQACAGCAGKGSVPLDPCASCGGVGKAAPGPAQLDHRPTIKQLGTRKP